jgi:hypothetical protein
MKKRPNVAIIETSENTGAQVLTNSTSREWSVVKSAVSAGVKGNLLGPFRYGKGVRVEYFDSVAEVRQLITIGATLAMEVIVAATVYKIKIGDSNNYYESQKREPVVFSTLSPALVSAYVDRATVYSALVAKINAYPGLNCVAHGLLRAAYTIGTDQADAGHPHGFTVGETVTQETTAATAKIAAYTIVTGTFHGTNATGLLWLYDLSTTDALWDTTGLYITGSTSHNRATITNATTYFDQGIAIRDNANYFTSDKQRGGVSSVFVGENFDAVVPVVTIAGVYPEGIGTVMLAQKPVFDPSTQELISGSLEYDFQDGMNAVAGSTYCKCVITTADGDEDSMCGTLEDAERESILYMSEATADHITDIKAALDAAIIL